MTALHCHEWGRASRSGNSCVLLAANSYFPPIRASKSARLPMTKSTPRRRNICGPSFFTLSQNASKSAAALVTDHFFMGRPRFICQYTSSPASSVHSAPGSSSHHRPLPQIGRSAIDSRPLSSVQPPTETCQQKSSIHHTYRGYPRQAATSQPAAPRFAPPLRAARRPRTQAPRRGR